MADDGPGSKPPTWRDVFVQSVKDHLDGTPNAHHPVQFAAVDVDAGGAVACTLCGALVVATEHWQTVHRENHDRHNKVHARIAEAATSHPRERRYG